MPAQSPQLEKWRERFPDGMTDEEIFKILKNCNFNEEQIIVAIQRIWEDSVSEQPSSEWAVRGKKKNKEKKPGSKDRRTGKGGRGASDRSPNSGRGRGRSAPPSSGYRDRPQPRPRGAGRGAGPIPATSQPRGASVGPVPQTVATDTPPPKSTTETPSDNWGRLGSDWGTVTESPARPPPNTPIENAWSRGSAAIIAAATPKPDTTQPFDDPVSEVPSSIADMPLGSIPMSTDPPSVPSSSETDPPLGVDDPQTIGLGKFVDSSENDMAFRFSAFGLSDDSSSAWNSTGNPGWNLTDQQSQDAANNHETDLSPAAGFFNNVPEGEPLESNPESAPPGLGMSLPQMKTVEELEGSEVGSEPHAPAPTTAQPSSQTKAETAQRSPISEPEQKPVSASIPHTRRPQAQAVMPNNDQTSAPPYPYPNFGVDFNPPYGGYPMMVMPNMGQPTDEGNNEEGIPKDQMQPQMQYGQPVPFFAPSGAYGPYYGSGANPGWFGFGGQYPGYGQTQPSPRGGQMDPSQQYPGYMGMEYQNRYPDSGFMPPSGMHSPNTSGQSKPNRARPSEGQERGGRRQQQQQQQPMQQQQFWGAYPNANGSQPQDPVMWQTMQQFQMMPGMPYQGGGSAQNYQAFGYQPAGSHGGAQPGGWSR